MFISRRRRPAIPQALLNIVFFVFFWTKTHQRCKLRARPIHFASGGAGKSTSTYIYIYIYMYICVYIYIYMYMYTYSFYILTLKEPCDHAQSSPQALCLLF